MTTFSTSNRVRDAHPRGSWKRLALAVPLLALLANVGSASANGLLENTPWQFPTAIDRWNKSLVLDQIEKMKGGYYDAVKSTYTTNNTTYIDRQVNCSVTAGSSGNTGTNSTTASTSSPSVSSSGATNANSAANAATNGVTQSGVNGVLVSAAGTPPSGSISNGQSNSGSLASSVDGSNTNSATGPFSANGGTSDQVLNSNQTNSGSQTASVANSSACVGPLN